MAPPEFDRTSALFLDFDGTLVEIAATAEQVVVPPGLPDLLAQLYRQLGGALALVSGRPLAQTDWLLRPFFASGAGEHGVSLRYDDGTLEELPIGIAVPQSWRAALESAVERWPGVRIEEKPHGVTVHYRLSPAGLSPAPLGRWRPASLARAPSCGHPPRVPRGRGCVSRAAPRLQPPGGGAHPPLVS